jgi:hypothetical protein
MPYPFYAEFDAYVLQRPMLFRRWRFSASFDDGKVETVTGTPRHPRKGPVADDPR